MSTLKTLTIGAASLPLSSMQKSNRTGVAVSTAFGFWLRSLLAQ